MHISKKLKLKNGLVVWVSRLPNTHSVTVDLFVRSGVAYETSDKLGITHLLEHLIFRELQGFSQRELYFFMESLGTTLKAVTYRDFLRFYLKVLPENAVNAMRIFKSILQTHSWSSDAFNAEKAVVKRQVIEDTVYNIDYLSRRLVFGENTFSDMIMGSEETVDLISVNDVAAFKERCFNSNNMVLCIAGNISDKQLSEMCRSLDDVSIIEGEKLINSFVPKHFGKRKNNIHLENADWDMIDVDLCFDIDSSDITFDEVELLNCILGEGVGSKLQEVLRENEHLTANISSLVDRYENFSVLHILFSTDCLYDALKQIVAVLNGMKYKIDESDLATSLPFYGNNLDFYLDDTEQLNFLNGYYGFVLNSEFKKSDLCNEGVVMNRLENISRQLFCTNNVSLTALGKCNEIRKNEILKILNGLDISF